MRLGRSSAGQHRLAAEHVQRQVAVVVVIGVELLEFLPAVQRNVRGIDIQNQLFGWTGKAGNEMVNQHLVQRPGIGAAGTGLEPTEGGRTGQCLIAPDGRLHQQVRAQRVVIVQIFVAAAQAVQTLGDEIAQAVANPPPGTPIGQRLGGQTRQTGARINLSQQHQPAIGTEVTTLEIGLQMTASKAPKVQLFSGTIWHRRYLPEILFRTSILCGLKGMRRFLLVKFPG